MKGLQDSAADALSSLAGPRFEGKRLTQPGIVAVGITAALAGMGFGSLGVFTFFTHAAELPAVFAYGMLGLAGLCLVIALGCFVPRSRSWALPLLVVVITVVKVLGYIAEQWRWRQ